MLDLCRDSTKLMRAWFCARCSIGCLNALEPGTIVPIHHHPTKDETFVILRGKIRWIFYDANDKETESVLLDADGDVRMIVSEKDRWHSLECLTSGAVLYESKDGAYWPLEEDETLGNRRKENLRKIIL